MMGAALFETKHFDHSVDFYKRAREQSSERETRPQLADALIFAGRYAEGCSLLREFLDDDPDARLGWHLKHWAIANAQATFGMPDQQRKPREAADLALRVTELSSDEEIRDRLSEALDQDRLSPEAWFNIGVAARKSDNAFLQTLGFVMAALVGRGIESWTNAALSAMQLWVEDDEQGDLVGSVIATGVWDHREQFIDALMDAADFSDETMQVLTEFVDGTLAEIAEENKRFELRLLGPGSEYESIWIDTDLQNEAG
jgi:tetratricopeptide (TPR) repeat protein